MERKLAAVMAADMVGYSRLMNSDEKGTLARLQTHRIELIDPSIHKNQGRIIKTTGDGMLVEFHSVVDAVRCAVEIQQRMGKRNADVDEDHRIRFRIGVNLGDIIFEDGDIFGDGVNIAARLEQLAEAGGICVTSAVHDQIQGRLDVAFEDLGDKSLKNIARPIHVFRVLAGGGGNEPGEADKQKQNHGAEGAKPAVAVLPFANLSGDAEQEFFVDGLTEDILTELSRHRELFVISRNSTFVYKGRAVNIRDIAKDLGAQYVVEGSVRKAGDRIRITVQLIDTQSDAHIWAERYDRKLDDIFEIQDEVTSSIVSTLPGRVEAARHDRLAKKKPSNMAAYECALAAKVLHHRSTVEANLEALDMVNRALEIDPEYAHAYAWKACILGQAWGYGWTEDADATFKEAEAALKMAFARDENDADVHRIQAAVHIAYNDLVRARHHQERALELNPNYDLVVVQMGELFTWLGHPEEGIEWIKKAMRLNPHFPTRFWSHLGRAQFAARQYAEAVKSFMHLSTMDTAQHAFVAACYGWLGDSTAAGAHITRLLGADETFDCKSFLATMHYARESDLEHLREGLVRAGCIPREKTAST